MIGVRLIPYPFASPMPLFSTPELQIRKDGCLGAPLSPPPKNGGRCPWVGTQEAATERSRAQAQPR